MLFVNLPISIFSFPQFSLEEVGIILAILGIILAMAIPVLFEQWKKPDLDIIAMNEEGRGAAQYKFVHLRVVNKPHKIVQFIERNYANEARANITFIDKSSGNELFSMPCKWSGKPEPVELIYSPQAGGNIYVLDVTKISEAESTNIAPGKDGEVLDVAIKHNGEIECYGFNAQSYAPQAQPGWKDPNKRISLPQCLLKVKVTSGDISKAKDFTLKNPDKAIENFVCI
jgi:hypothetical protein